MPFTAQEIREMIETKAAEIQASSVHTCLDCAVELSEDKTHCDDCEKKLVVAQLRRLAQIDSRYEPVLSEVEASETEQDPPQD